MLGKQVSYFYDYFSFTQSANLAVLTSLEELLSIWLNPNSEKANPKFKPEDVDKMKEPVVLDPEVVEAFWSIFGIHFWRTYINI